MYLEPFLDHFVNETVVTDVASLVLGLVIAVWSRTLVSRGVRRRHHPLAKAFPEVTVCQVPEKHVSILEGR